MLEREWRWSQVQVKNYYNFYLSFLPKFVVKDMIKAEKTKEYSLRKSPSSTIQQNEKKKLRRKRGRMNVIEVLVEENEFFQ